MMESALPSHIIFYRAPIPAAETAAKETPVRATSSAAAELDAASDPVEPPKPQLTTIFGSVSTTDIAESMKAVLAEVSGGDRIVLGPDEVTITAGETEGLEQAEKGTEGNRIKVLGDFKVEVRVKGGDPISRIVSVRAQEKDSES